MRVLYKYIRALILGGHVQNVLIDRGGGSKQLRPRCSKEGSQC